MVLPDSHGAVSGDPPVLTSGTFGCIPRRQFALLRYTTFPMSSSRPAVDSESRNLTLDTASFQRLLAAAWAIQCEQDRIAAQSGGFEQDFCKPVTTSELLAWAGNPSVPQDSRVYPSIARENIHPRIAQAPKFPPARAKQSCGPEIVGSLALAHARDIASPDGLAASDGLEVLPSRSDKLHRVEPRPRPILTVLTPGKKQPGTTQAPFRFLRKTPAALLIGIIVVLVAVITFVTFKLWHDGVASGKLTANISEKAIEPASRRAGNAADNSAYLESTHLRVTDSSIASELDELSRYEINTIRRQAEFGNDDAALLLAMAYEIGKGVPQSCAQAAHWVGIAAQDGNAAAQYNLALRYFNGDGIPVDRNEAKKWFLQSSSGGYEEAQQALRHLSF